MLSLLPRRRWSVGICPAGWRRRSHGIHGLVTSGIEAARGLTSGRTRALAAGFLIPHSIVPGGLLGDVEHSNAVHAP